MLKTWYQRAIDFITNKKHAFIMKSSNNDTASIKTSPLIEKDVDIDVYSDCKVLFNVLNNHKNYYQFGYVEKNDKKNTSNILINMINLTNPKIKMFSYSSKNLAKPKCR